VARGDKIFVTLADVLKSYENGPMAAAEKEGLLLQSCVRVSLPTTSGRAGWLASWRRNERTSVTRELNKLEFDTEDDDDGLGRLDPFPSTVCCCERGWSRRRAGRRVECRHQRVCDVS